MSRAERTLREESGLVGSWRLLSFELQAPDGTISHPYGKELSGYLFYNADGYMSAAFMNAERGTAPSVAELRTGDPAEDGDLAEAGRTNHYDQFMAYCGGYSVEGDRIRHRVEVSSLAIWTGSLQERWFKIDGDRLELLTTPLSIGSDTPLGRLVWERSRNAVIPS